MEKQKKYSSIYVVFSFIKLAWKANGFYAFFFLSIPLLFGLVPIADAYIFKKIIDSFTEQNNSFEYLLVLIAVLFVIRILDGFSHELHRFFYTRLKDTLTPQIVGKIIEKVSKLKYSDFENAQVIKLVEKVRHNSDYRPVDMLQKLPGLISNFITFISSIIGISLVGWWAVPLIILGTIPSIWVSRIRSRADYSISDNRSPMTRIYGYMERITMDFVFVKEISLFGAYGRIWGKMKEIFDQFAFENKKLSTKNLILETIAIISSLSTLGASFVYLAYITFKGTISIGSLTFNLSLLSNLSNSSQNVFNEITGIQEDVLYLRDFFVLFDLEEEKFEGEKLKDFDFKEISFENVSFRYPEAENYVFKDIDITFKKGEKIALVGVNGAGKTTFIKLLLRFYKPENGIIKIDGKDINSIDKNDWYKLFGVLFQDFIKFAFTAKENIEFGNPDLQDENLLKLSIEKADATELVNALPQKENTLLSKWFENGVDLSGGQWQRIALARMYYRDAQILILDEPTAAIDAESEAKIFESVQRLSREKTVFIISHRFSTVRRADRIIVMNEGSIIEQGTHDELLNLDGKYAKMFKLQAEGYR